VLPAVMLVLAAAIGGMQVAGEQLRLQAATIDAARMLGRGDEGAAALVGQLVRGASVRESSRGDLICAETRAPTALGALSVLALRASACVLRDVNSE
jgi:hypothetical protein